MVSEESKFFYASVEMLGQESAYLGSALLQQGSYAEAEAELRKATAKNQSNAEWWALLGAAQFAQHKYLSAQRSLRSAVFLEPDNEKYAALLSRVRRGAGL